MTFRGWEKAEIKLTNGEWAEAICPYIISASRATDIPAYFSTWFRNRLRAGYMRWTNPFNAKQTQYVSFQRTRVIVFWTKNPLPLIPYLPEIEAKGINYYFQYTLNDYEKDGIEPNLPPLPRRIDTFKGLAERLGKKRVIWRYDPLILTQSLTIDILVERIARVAEMLRKHTEKLVVSFADISNYKKVQNNLKRHHVHYHEFTPSLMKETAKRLSALGQACGLKIATCAESIELDRYGIEHNRCIDDNLMIELFRDDRTLMNFLGYQPNLFGESFQPYLKDKGQRKDCGCIVSKDIGMYNTCSNLCTYCYANTSCQAVRNNLKKHQPDSETLI
jgi:DNA repair photolyase